MARPRAARASIDPDQLMTRPLGEISAAEFLEVLAHPKVRHPALAILPDKKKYELWVEEGPIFEIPLEQVVAGVEYLRSHPEVDDERIWLVGGSRGSDAAMLTAIAHPGLVDGVVASVPGSAAVCGIPCDGPAWTIDGEGVPSTRLYGATEPNDRPDAVIPVQDLEGRLVTVCGEQDETWPSCRHAGALEERRERAGVGGQDRHFAYEDAGHDVGWLAHAPRVLPARLYGGPDEEARRDLWPQLVEIILDEEPATG
jgi:uncharacterized protein